MEHFDGNSINNEARQFLIALSKDIKASSVDLKHWDIDHLCYRVATESEYHKFKKVFSDVGTLLIESEVNGRLISTFKLRSPLYFESHTVDVIELPAPKKGKSTPTGFEHIEVVVDEPLEELGKKYSLVPQDHGGLKKPLNQELELILKSGAVKFHYQSLESVIRLEKNKSFQNFLKKSLILEKLKPYHPLIAGTFPLGLQVQESDVDIICSGRDLQELEDHIRREFQYHEDFSTQKMNVRGENSILCRWKMDGLAVELFAQTTFSCRQWAFKHFQLEDRLLKLGGEPFYESVKSLRQRGLKTEPAFWLALHEDQESDFEGIDIYEKLHEISFSSEEEIRRQFSLHSDSI